MFNLDPAKLLVILVVALIVLGPERLPKAARQIGAVWHELNRIRDQVSEEVRAALPVDDLPKLPNTSRAISGFFNNLTAPAATEANGHADDSLSAASIDDRASGPSDVASATGAVQATAAASERRPGPTPAGPPPFGFDDPSMN